MILCASKRRSSDGQGKAYRMWKHLVGIIPPDFPDSGDPSRVFEGWYYLLTRASPSIFVSSQHKFVLQELRDFFDDSLCL